MNSPVRCVLGKNKELRRSRRAQLSIPGEDIICLNRSNEFYVCQIMGKKTPLGEGHCSPGIGCVKNSHHWIFLEHLLGMTGTTLS